MGKSRITEMDGQVGDSVVVSGQKVVCGECACARVAAAFSTSVPTDGVIIAASDLFELFQESRVFAYRSHIDETHVAPPTIVFIEAPGAEATDELQLPTPPGAASEATSEGDACTAVCMQERSHSEHVTFMLVRAMKKFFPGPSIISELPILREADPHHCSRQRQSTNSGGQAHMQPASYRTTNEAPAIIRLPEVIRVIGLSRASIYRFMEAGDFPRQFKLGTSAVGWLRKEVEAWIDERAGQRWDHHRDVEIANAA